MAIEKAVCSPQVLKGAPPPPIPTMSQSRRAHPKATVWVRRQRDRGLGFTQEETAEEKAG